MALDLTAPDAPRRWFGFSPLVVIVAVAMGVLIGGGAIAMASRPDPYVAAVGRVCALSEEAMTRGDSEPPAGASVMESNIFTVVTDNTERRLAGLRAISPSPEHATFHARLVASEENVARLAAVGQAEVIRIRARGARGLMPYVDAVLASMRSPEALYVELGIPKGCSD